MGLEIEKKFRLSVKRMSEVRLSLERSRAQNKGLVFEENTIYGGGALDGFAGVLRVRRTNGKTMLTLKRRFDDASDIKQQIENETEIANAAELIEILSGIGFSPRLVYEKRRETWHYRKVEIVLDELPFGLFMEIEGSLTGIREAEIMLGLDDLQVVQETYPQLASRLGTLQSGIIQCRFSDTVKRLPENRNRPSSA
jgi:adenylate cyclase class 2